MEAERDCRFESACTYDGDVSTSVPSSVCDECGGNYTCSQTAGVGAGFHSSGRFRFRLWPALFHSLVSCSAAETQAPDDEDGTKRRRSYLGVVHDRFRHNRRDLEFPLSRHVGWLVVVVARPFRLILTLTLTLLAVALNLDVGPMLGRAGQWQRPGCGLCGLGGRFCSWKL